MFENDNEMNSKNSIYRTFIFLGFFSLLLASCSKEDDPVLVDNVTQIPNDVTKLFIEKGNTGSNKVILYCNGDPDNTLETTYFDDLELSEFHEVYVHQSNTYNQEIITGLNANLTFDRAIKENDVSVEMLHKVAVYFKNKGKNVYIVGHSFGAILIPSLIANKEPIAEKYLLMAGRLNFPDLVWQGFRDRQGYYFEDGVTPTEQNFDSSVSEVEKKEYYARMRLQAGFGKNRYTQLLQNKDLSNVIYAFGEKDEAVGRLAAEEVNFFKHPKC